MPEFSILEVRHPDDQHASAPISLLCQRTEETKGSISTIHFRISIIRPNRYAMQDARTHFVASHDSQSRRISLSSLNPNDGTGTIFIDPERLRGLRLGSYLMSEIVEWSQKWPEATVNHIRLSEVQETPGNVERRAKFYANLGVVFSRDERQITAAELVRPKRWTENITATPLEDYLTDQIMVRNELEKLKQEVQHLKARTNERTSPGLFQSVWAKIAGNFH